MEEKAFNTNLELMGVSESERNAIRKQHVWRLLEKQDRVSRSYYAQREGFDRWGQGRGLSGPAPTAPPMLATNCTPSVDCSEDGVEVVPRAPSAGSAATSITMAAGKPAALSSRLILSVVSLALKLAVTALSAAMTLVSTRMLSVNSRLLLASYQYASTYQHDVSHL